jgi:transposase
MAAIHSDEFKRDAVRIALTSGLTRRQVAADLGVGHSTLGKWIRVFSEESKAPAQDAELLRENERDPPPTAGPLPVLVYRRDFRRRFVGGFLLPGQPWPDPICCGEDNAFRRRGAPLQ